MNYFLIMECLKSQNHLIENWPHIIFLRESWSFLCIVNFSLQIAIIAVFHDNTQAGRAFLKKCLLVPRNICMVHRCKYPDLIQSILFFFCTQFLHFNLDQNKQLVNPIATQVPRTSLQCTDIEFITQIRLWRMHGLKNEHINLWKELLNSWI